MYVKRVHPNVYIDLFYISGARDENIFNLKLTMQDLLRLYNGKINFILQKIITLLIAFIEKMAFNMDEMLSTLRYIFQLPNHYLIFQNYHLKY